MELLLWRHAEAAPGGVDLDRRLTAAGSAQAQRVGAWLSTRLRLEARILVSPAMRAQQTARALGRAFAVVADLAPGASARSVLAVAGWPDAIDAVVIVGHQPTLGDVASLAVTGSERGWPIAPAALWWLATRQRDGANVLVKAVIDASLA